MIRRPPRSTHCISSAASDVYKRQGIDLAPDYLEKTERALKPWSRAATMQGAAEALPLDTASQDIVTACYLFHELPPDVRTRALEEVVRVLKPGGRFILIDALQTGDHAALDALLEFFPRAFHAVSYTHLTLPTICSV